MLVSTWREELLSRAWSALAQDSASENTFYYPILRYRVEHPAENYEQLSQAFSEICGREIKAGNARIQIHRARLRFAALMIQQVSDSLPDADSNSVEAELADLGLLHYCREVLIESKS